MVKKAGHASRLTERLARRTAPAQSPDPRGSMTPIRVCTESLVTGSRTLIGATPRFDACRTATRGEPKVSRTVRLSLGLARFCLAGWVGAAALFVVVGVREVRLPELDSLGRAALALARFPMFYAFGFSLCGASCGALLVANLGCRHRALRASLLLACVGLLVMLADYLLVYRPLVAMLQTPESARPAAFVTYHRASMYVNAVGWTFNLVAALLACAAEPLAVSEGGKTRGGERDTAGENH